MIDSRASILLMLKKIADALGIEYTPISLGVLQIDGTSVNIVGVIKGLNLTLHSYPNLTIS